MTTFTIGWVGKFTDINEVTPDDSDFIRSYALPQSDGTTTALFEVGLDDLTDPTTGVGHIMRYRYKKQFTGGSTIALRVRLLDGTISRASRTHSNISSNWTQAESVLTVTEANAISDYTDLRLDFLFTATGTGNSRAGMISWAEFEGGA